MSPTPLRQLHAPDQDGVIQLGSTAGTWVDGGEQRVLEVLLRATDLSSTSEELRSAGVDWETRYHLSPERANIVRGLDLAPDAAVLEIGAGCGAVTRYVGERARTVDALEPTPLRARVAAARCRDVSGVQVACGHLDDLPDGAAYDVALVIGVLEYVGGRDGIDDRVQFLEAIRRRLRPGGTVVLAIENRLGVQYLAGAAEDHLGVPFAGLEDYPDPGPVRTFDRRALEDLFRRAGLDVRTYGVFPDYKFTRLVYSADLLDSDARDLAWRAPAFPSNASPHPLPELVDEGRLWRGLIDAGLGAECPNSLLAIATRPDAPDTVWPAGQLAAYFSAGRVVAHSTLSRVLRSGEGGLFVRRERLAEVPSGEGIAHRPAIEAPWIAGDVLIERLAAGATPEDRRPWLERWVALVRREAAAGTEANLDLIPHNVVIDGTGLAIIDEEYFGRDWSPNDVVARGLLTSALTLARTSPSSSWPGCETCRDLHAELCRLAGVPELHERLAETVRREAEVLAEVEGSSVEAKLANLDAALGAPLPQPKVPGSPAFRRLEQRADELHRTVDWLHAEVARHVAEIERLRTVEAEQAAQLASLPTSTPERSAADPEGPARPHGRLRRFVRAALRR